MKHAVRVWNDMGEYRRTNIQRNCQLIQCAALMYGDAQDVNTERNERMAEMVRKLCPGATDLFYTLANALEGSTCDGQLRCARRAMIFTRTIYETEPEYEDFTKMPAGDARNCAIAELDELSDEYFQSFSNNERTAWLAAVCEACDCSVCKRVLVALQCAG